MGSRVSQQEESIPKLRKITLAFDGSANSFEACEAASIIAKACGAEVTVVYALPPIRALSTPLRVYYDSNLEKIETESIGKVVSLLNTTQGVKARGEILHSKGSISEALIKYINEEKSDLVVAGTRGLGGFKRMMLGSVSSNLVSHSPSSVLVVRGNQQDGKKVELKRILVATDGSESSARAQMLAISLAKSLGGKLSFVNVVYIAPTAYPIDGGIGFDKVIQDLKESGKAATTAAASIAEDNGVKADTRVVDNFQSPVVALTKLAEKEKYNLIVLGTRGLGGFRKLALGSVANGVVHYAHCSVLIAK